MPRKAKVKPSRVDKDLSRERVEIPAWQMNELMMELDALVREEYEKEKAVLQKNITSLSESYERQLKIIRQDDFTMNHQRETILKLEAQIGRICIEKGIVE